MAEEPSGSVTAVSILNWNGLAETLACLSGIDVTHAPNIHIVVLDNGSAVDPASSIAAQFPHVEVIRLPENLGFTGGHNHVLRLAMKRRYHSVLVLNNDCSLEVASVLRMRSLMDERPDAGAVSALVYRRGPERRAMMVAGHIDWSRLSSIRPSNPDTTKPEEAPTLLVGTAVLLRCSAMQEIGLLDDRYFAYYDDNDLSARLAAANMVALYCRDAICLHDYKTLVDHSTVALYLLSRNRWLFWKSHTPQPYRHHMNRRLLGQALHDIALLIKNRAPAEKVNAVVDGIWDAWHGAWGAPPSQQYSPAWLRLMLRHVPYRVGVWLSA